MSSLIEQAKERIHNKYEYLTDEDLDTCYNTAVKDYLLRKYPSDNNRPTIDKLEDDFIVAQWIYDRMEDILSRAGGTNLTAYKENGVSFTWASSYIDSNLVAQLMPKGSVPK